MGDKKSKTGKLVFNISDEEYNSVIISCGKQGTSDNKKVKLHSEESKIKNNKDVIQNEKLEESNIVGHLLSYKGNNISTFVDDNIETWWKSSDIMKVLGYKDVDKVVRKNVSHENKNTLEFFRKTCPAKLAGHEFSHIDKNAIYVNTSGFFELLDGSGKKEAKEFKYWVNNEVLPTINKTGKYELYEKKKLIIHDNIDGFTNWYDMNDELSLKDKSSVFYIGIVGIMENVNDHDCFSNIKDGEIIMKYGISNVEETKRFIHHKQTIGAYMCVYVTSVFRNKLLENDIKSFLDRKNALRHMHFGNHHYKELFSLSNVTLDDVIAYVEKWCDKCEYNADIENTLKLEKEKTKQLELIRDMLNNPNIQHIDKLLQVMQLSKNNL